MRRPAWPWGRKESRTASVLLPFPNAPPRNYKNDAQETYKINVRAQAAVRLVSTACASIPWILYRGEGEVERHELLDLIKRPNEYQSQSSFIEELLSYLLLWGNDFVEGEFPSTPGRPPVHLYNIRPQYISIIPGQGKKIAIYRYTNAGRIIDYKPEEMMQLKLFNPDNDFWGMGLAEAAGLSIDQNNLSKQWNVNLLTNGAKVGGILTSSTALSDDEIESLREQINANYKSTNIGKPMVMEGNFEWTPMSLSATDMDWLEGQKMSGREIALAFAVPPEMLGDTETKTYSNYQEARQAFYTEGVFPLLDKVRDEFNAWLCPKWAGQDLRLDYDMDSVDAFSEDRSEVWSNAVQGVNAGIITPNEARAMLQYDPIEGGDALTGGRNPMQEFGNSVAALAADQVMARFGKKKDPMIGKH